MPTIQQFNRQQGTLPSNPGEAQIASRSGAVAWRAVGQLGDQISQLGGEFLARQTRAEEADEIRKQSQDDADAIRSFEDSIRAEYQSTDPNTGEVRFDPRGPRDQDPEGNVSYPQSYSARVGKFIEERYAAGQAAMSSGRARESYKDSAFTFFSRERLRAEGFQREQTANVLAADMNSTALKAVDSIYRAPTLANLTNQIKLSADYFEANKEGLLSGMSPEQVKKIHDDSARGMVINGYMRGLLKTDPALGLRIMKDQVAGKNGQDPKLVKQYMKGDDVADWTERFQSKVTEQNNVQIFHNQNRLKDIQASAVLGTGTGTITEARQIIDQNAAFGFYKNKEEKVRAYSDVVQSLAVGEVTKKMQGMTNEEIQQAVPKAQGLLRSEVQRMASREGLGDLPKDFAAGDQLQTQIKMQQAVAQIMDNRRKDPAQSVVGSNDALMKSYQESQGGLGPTRAMNENYFAQSVGEQKRLGIQQPRVLPQEQAKQLKIALETGSAESAAKSIADLQGKTGAYFPQVMDQLVKDANLPAYYVTAGYVDDPNVSAKIIDGLKNKGTFDAVLRDKNLGYKKSDVQAAVNKAMQPYFEAIVGSGSSAENVKVAEGLRQGSLYVAADSITRGMSAQDAAEQAVQSVIGRTKDVYRGAIIPREKSEAIRVQMDWVNTDDFIKKNSVNIVLPDDLPSNGVDIKGRIMGAASQAAWSMTDVQRRDEARTQKVRNWLSDRNATRWVNKSDGSGATLFLKTDRGLQPVRQRDGKFIEVDF